MSKLLLLGFLVSVLGGEDYYKLLGVPRDADEQTIKKAFKKLSLKMHPDKHPSRRAEAESEFMDIANAYDVLTDPKLRNLYDRFGEEGVKEGGDPNRNRRYQDFHQQGGFRFRQQRRPPLFENTDVIEMEFNDINRLFRRNEIWLILFYNPNCKPCQESKPMWVELASKLYGIVKIAAVNCLDEEELCEEYEINSYPSIIYFPENTAQEHEKYTGKRSYKDISDFAVSRMQSFVRIVTAANLNDFKAPEMPKVILFTDRKNTPPLLKALSKAFKDKVAVGEARDPELAQEFGVKEFPTLVGLNENLNVYDNDMNKDQISSWIRKLVQNYKAPIGQVKELNRSLYFTGKCAPNDNNYCFIAFVSPDESIQIVKETAARFSTDPIDFYWVNPSKYQGFANAFGSKYVIYRAKRKKFVQIDCEDARCLIDKCNAVLSGSASFIKLEARPDLVEKKEEL